MDYLVEGEVVLLKFRGGLSCKGRLFFGLFILTNYRLIIESSSIQGNPGAKSEIFNKPFHHFSTRKIEKDTFLAKLTRQNFAKSIAHLNMVYQFPTTNVIKRRVKKNQYIYEANMEYESDGVFKTEVIKVRIQPKRDKGESYSIYQNYCESIFNKLNKVLKIE